MGFGSLLGACRLSLISDGSAITFSCLDVSFDLGVVYLNIRRRLGKGPLVKSDCLYPKKKCSQRKLADSLPVLGVGQS